MKDNFKKSLSENKDFLEDHNDHKIHEIGTYLIHKHIGALKKLAKCEPGIKRE